MILGRGGMHVTDAATIQDRNDLIKQDRQRSYDVFFSTMNHYGAGASVSSSALASYRDCESNWHADCKSVTSVRTRKNRFMRCSPQSCQLRASAGVYRGSG